MILGLNISRKNNIWDEVYNNLYLIRETFGEELIQNVLFNFDSHREKSLALSRNCDCGEMRTKYNKIIQEGI